MILAYLEAIFEDGDPELIAAGLNNVVRACGVKGATPLTPDLTLDSAIRTMKALGWEPMAKTSRPIAQ